MAIPCLLHSSMLKSSRIEPPGWITAFMPALAASSIVSGKGKKASEARTEFLTLSPALSMAWRAASTLLG